MINQNPKINADKDAKRYWFCLGMAAAFHLIRGNFKEYDALVRESNDPA